MKRVYLDYTATAPTKPEVFEKMKKYYTEQFGNPSSVHTFGLLNRDDLLEARKIVATTINADVNELFFTSGGTESDNWAIAGVAKAMKNKGKHLITTKIEHHAVLHTMQDLEKQGFEVTYLEVDDMGKIDLENLKSEIREDTILVSIMYANNEVGTVQDIAEIGKICKEKKVYFHTDAVQAYGNFLIDVKKLNIDLMTMSGHKIYGPKGVGALYVRKGVKIKNILHGGAQERKKRPGTENVPAIIGFAEAARIAHKTLDEHREKLIELRDYLRDRVLNEIDHVKYNGHPTDRHPGNTNFSFHFIEGESLLIGLDMRGIAGSSGSACTSGSLDPSHVLMALGLSHDIAHGSLRLTVGDFTTKEEIDYTVEQLKEVITWLRNMSPLYEDFLNKQK